MPELVFNEDSDNEKEEINDQTWEGQTMELRDQILHRPDTYIGITVNKERIDYIYSEEDEKIISKNIIGNKGLERFLEEILSNVVDNKTRSDEKKIPMKKIKVKFQRVVPTSGGDKKERKDKNNKNDIRFTVWNDGKTIPIGLFKKTGRYNPEMAFCNLLTSENYDDTKKRKTSGRNGYGSKLTNIFSTNFRIRTYDKAQKLLYVQEISDNMRNINKPIITKTKDLPKDELNGFTEISWIPDLSYFEMKEYSDDFLSLLKKFCFDCSMVSKVPLYFTGLDGKEVLLPVKNLLSYANLFVIKSDESDDGRNNDEDENEEDEENESENKKTPKKKKNKKNEIISFSFRDEKDNYSEVVLIPSNGKELEHMAFVNGCYTPDGGVHVEGWCETIFRPIVEKINSKGKRKVKEGKIKKEEKKGKAKTKKERPKINIKDVKNNFMIFVDSWLDKPKFDSQAKNKLSSPELIDIKVDQKNINKLMKWSFVDHIEDIIKMKEFMSLKSTQAKKGETIVLSGYDKANLAGKEPDCILAVCEGLSAKSTLTGGLSVGMLGKSGRDYIGLYAVKGKILNCRNAKPSQIAKNKEIVGLIKILKLIYEEDYSDDNKFLKLPYHKLCIFTDADDDGIHIRGLIINLFDYLWPALLNRDFLYVMNTPILTIEPYKNEPQKMFYDQRVGLKYISDNKLPKSIIKYFKGLGGWKSNTFKQICGKLTSKLYSEKDSRSLVNKAFNKDFADIRKKWVSDNSEVLSLDEDEKGTEYKKKASINDLSISTFIQTDLVEFFKTLCKRSLVNLYDGLKESQRKILFGLLKSKLTYKKKSKKLVQSGSIITEKSNYHYGEQNLYDTAGRMAQTFVGSNNIPLLYDDGSFGTRLNNKDMASPRYIATKLNYLTEYIFRDEDNRLIKQLEEEGLKIEPEYYIPVIPMVLVNGCVVGIGSGWRCTVPAHNVEDLIKWIKIWLKYDGKIVIIDGKNVELCEESNKKKNKDEKEESNKKGDIDKNEEGIKMLETPELIPWYRGFTGEIEVEEKKIITKGVMKKGKKEDQYRITEIPVGVYIDTIKEKLEKLEAEKKIKFTNNSSKKDENSIDFIITMNDKKKPSLKSLGLEKAITTNNMALFTENYNIKKYNNADLIMDKYCKKRLEFYTIRKNHKLNELEEKKTMTNNKIKFINEYIEGKLIINKRKRIDVDKDLDKKGFDRMFEKNNKAKVDDEENEDNGDNKKEDNKKGKVDKDDNTKNFNYLWKLKLEHLTTEKMETLKKQLEKIGEDIQYTKAKKEKDQWNEELDEFLVHYHKWLKMIV